MIRQMRYYIAVVEAGSFSEAAVVCHISQSAISQQIKALIAFAESRHQQGKQYQQRCRKDEPEAGRRLFAHSLKSSFQRSARLRRGAVC